MSTVLYEVPYSAKLCTGSGKASGVGGTPHRDSEALRAGASWLLRASGASSGQPASLPESGQPTAVRHLRHGAPGPPPSVSFQGIFYIIPRLIF